MPQTFPPRRIAVMGKLGAGKSSLADALAERLGGMVLSFAGPLKDIAGDLWGLEGRTNRKRLQDLGRAIREIDPDTFVNNLIERATRVYPDLTIIVDDLRHENEYWALRSHAFTVVEVIAPEDIRVHRAMAIGKLGSVEELDDMSETALDDRKIYRPDFVVKNPDNNRVMLEEESVRIIDKLNHQDLL